MTCPKCSGLLVTVHADTYCINCGHRPPTFAAHTKPVLADLKCIVETCMRDRERNSQFCRQCVKTNRALIRHLRGECVNGHAATRENVSLVNDGGRIKQRCKACERERAQRIRDRKKGVKR